MRKTSLEKVMVELCRQELVRERGKLLARLHEIDAELSLIAVRQGKSYEPSFASPNAVEVAGQGSTTVVGGGTVELMANRTAT